MALINNANKELIEYLKNITLEELANILYTPKGEEKKPTENKSNVVDLNKDKKILYTIDDLINNYPFFTRYNINKAIQEKGLPYITIGNKRLFDKESVEKWIEKETKTKNERNKKGI